ncbi:hypothetical protein SAMN05216175_104250 [Neptunomonas qingdaonensis]|uniref:Uncharacterized protein n=1 Tax=Neptunomonas qingdaonensis TaxID=1045558 RepID=A0A1I2QDN1_9GAMM|nr:hypothetical protein SAMN05216175_104250 [Neptunomonas qingdaonensis]
MLALNYGHTVRNIGYPRVVWHLNCKLTIQRVGGGDM